MKANELRIGNYYTSVKFNAPVKCELSDLYELYILSDGATDYPPVERIFKPIPLTEEILLKCGFEKFGMAYVSFSFVINKWSDRMLMVGWSGGNVNVKYVHQLQNIYLALTGGELKIEL